MLVMSRGVGDQNTVQGLVARATSLLLVRRYERHTQTAASLGVTLLRRTLNDLSRLRTAPIPV
jgi:hypothetical protein